MTMIAKKYKHPLPIIMLLPEHTGRPVYYTQDVVRNLGALLRELPLGKWLAIDDVLGYVRTNDVCLTVVDPPIFRSGGGSTLAFRQLRTFAESLVVRPFLQGVVFLFNALGLMDLAYDLPETRTEEQEESLPRFSSRSNAQPPGISPFSGLRAFRLTPLGEYVVGRRTEPPALDVCAVGNTARLVADPRRLLLTLHGKDALLELLLKEVADTVAPGVFRLSAAKVLDRCVCLADVVMRLDRLRQVLPKELPPLWQEHLKQLQSRAVPPKAEPFSVYKLKPGSALAVAIAQTPELAELVLHAEGGHILVRRDQHEVFSKKLLALGFIPPK